MRYGVRLTLKQIACAGPVQIGFRNRCRQAKEHELRGYIDSRTKLDGNLAKVCHLQGDPRVEARIDLRSRDMDRHADASPTASPFDEPCKIRRDVDGLECLSEDEPAWLESEGVGLTMFPEVRRIPQRRIDMNTGQVMRRLLEGRELVAELQVDRDLSDTILTDRGIKPQLSFAEVRENVRLGQQQAAECCSECLRTVWKQPVRPPPAR